MCTAPHVYIVTVGFQKACHWCQHTYLAVYIRNRAFKPCYRYSIPGWCFQRLIWQTLTVCHWYLQYVDNNLLKHYDVWRQSLCRRYNVNLKMILYKSVPCVTFKQGTVCSNGASVSNIEYQILNSKLNLLMSCHWWLSLVTNTSGKMPVNYKWQCLQVTMNQLSTFLCLT